MNPLRAQGCCGAIVSMALGLRVLDSCKSINDAVFYLLL